MAILRWTSHPLVDVGIAALCAMTRRAKPEDITVGDLDEATDELAANYFNGVMSSYLSCVFTLNAGYTNPTMGKDKRAEYATAILKAYQREPLSPQLTCAFSGEPAVEVVHRAQIPMLTGEDTLNFFSAIRGGLPIAGTYLTAIQALPMGCKRVEGKLFAVHADNAELTIAVARRYVEDNRRLAALGKAGKFGKGVLPELGREVGMGDKYPDSKGAASLIAWDLMQVLQERELFRSGARLFGSITCYWMSNSGQGPSLDLFHVPSNLIVFLREAGKVDHAGAWSRAVAGAWRPVGGAGAEDDKTPRKSKRKAGVAGGPGKSRNDLLDDLLGIYRDGGLSRENAARFIRRHLVRYRRGDANAPRIERAEWMNWKLTELFLKEVLGMTQERIDRIREFADRLAGHIAAINDRRLFRGVVYSTRPYELRNALTRAQRSEAHDHNKLLFGLVDYLDVFENEEVVRLGDWSLTRDLISIRLVEILHEKGFFEKNTDLLEEPVEQEAS